MRSTTTSTAAWPACTCAISPSGMPCPRATSLWKRRWRSHARPCASAWAPGRRRRSRFASPWPRRWSWPTGASALRSSACPRSSARSSTCAASASSRRPTTWANTRSRPTTALWVPCSGNTCLWPPRPSPRSTPPAWRPPCAGDETIGIAVAGREHTLTEQDVILTMKAPPGYSVEREGAHAVALDLTIDADLLREGHAREIVHAVQNARKSAGLQIEDRIELVLLGDPALIEAAREHRGVCQRGDARRRACSASGDARRDGLPRADRDRRAHSSRSPSVARKWLTKNVMPRARTQGIVFFARPDYTAVSEAGSSSASIFFLG